MKRQLKIIGFGLIAFLFLSFVTVTQVVQTERFQSYVRDKIVTATQDAIGGRVDLGSFSFDWRRLRAEITDFVIHGSEPADADPFLRVARVQVDLQLFTSFSRILNVSGLRVEQPRANVLTFADGTTNIPRPAKQSTSDTTPLKTIVDLAIGHFELGNGFAHYNALTQPIDIKGENLRVQLTYNLLTQGYRGQLSLQPLYVVQGRNTPVAFTVMLPIVLEEDKISLADATISTPESELKITGSVENLTQPEIRAQVNGHLAVSDLNTLGNLKFMPGPATSQVLINADVQVANNSVRVDQLEVQLGNSRIEATGFAKDAQGNGSLKFTSTLNLSELTQLVNASQKLTGDIAIDGTTQFADELISLQNVRVRGWGGELVADARLESFERYQVTGTLQGMNLQTLEQRLGMKALPYDGTVSGGFEAKGDLKAANAGLQASVNLQVTPGRRGVPLSGRVNAEYNADRGIVQARNSFLALPNSRLNFAGSLQNGLRFDLTSQNLNDLFVAVPGAPPPVRLSNGKLQITGVVAGTIDSPRINGHVATTRLVVQDRQFDTIATDFSAIKSGFALQNGSLSRGTMHGNFAGALGLVNWSPKPASPLTITASVNNGDLADILALAGQKSEGYSGVLAADVNVGGTFGNPAGAATVAIAAGTLAKEPFDQGHLEVTLSDQLIRVPSAYVTRDKSRIDLTAEYQHPRETLTAGHLKARVASTPIDLTNVSNVQSLRSGTDGVFQVNATVEGDLMPVQVEAEETSEFRLSSVAGDISAKGFRIEGMNYGDVAAHADTSGNTVTYNLSSNFAGSRIEASGRTDLAPDYPTELNAMLNDLRIEQALIAVKRGDIPARGIASGSIHLAGTLKEPHGQANVELRDTVLSEEPLDRVRLQANVEPTYIEISQMEVNAGPSQASLTGRFDHPQGSFEEGKITFDIRSRGVDLARIRNVQIRRPGLSGALDITAEGSGELRDSKARDRLTFETLQAQINATGLRMSQRNLGNLELKALGNSDKLSFALASTLNNSTLRGDGEAILRGDYPVKADLTFDDLTWANLQPLVASNSSGPATIDAATSGRISVNGPVLNLDQLNASLRVTKLQLRALLNQPLRPRPLTIQNEGDITIALESGQVRVQSAHLTGQEVDVNVSGSGSIRGENLDLRIDAKSNLELLEAFVPDLYSGGAITVAASVQGSIQKPSLNGRLELTDASIASGDLPVGLSKANGVIAFNGNTATIQKLTGEAGGGKISISGFVTRGESSRFSLQATANAVRVRIQQGVSAVASANLSIAGNTNASLVSGAVTIDRLTYLPQTDIGAILTRSSPPVQSPESPSPILQNMRLDIAVRTSSTTAVQASLAQNLQVSADLRVRGRAAQPGVTGTIQLNRGELAFFGTTYRLSTGTISFYNPTRIEPQLDITLETEAKGATVVLNVTGAIDNMKLSYTSDPPLQFDEIIALLAAGKPPTSDPTLLANQPSQPQQTLEQRGEAALLGKAVADPLANRLQRVFGVSQLKIDPTFTSGSQVPQARLTLQQQVAPNLVFTYVTALDNPNTQIARIEWSMTRHWAAIANRDENGVVSINLLYKQQFR